jgi:23S rRNA pseudouridine2605 synthase
MVRLLILIVLIVFAAVSLAHGQGYVVYGGPVYSGGSAGGYGGYSGGSSGGYGMAYSGGSSGGYGVMYSAPVYSGGSAGGYGGGGYGYYQQPSYYAPRRFFGGNGFGFNAGVNANVGFGFGGGGGGGRMICGPNGCYWSQ